MTEELVRNNMQRSRMLVEGSLSYDGLGEDPEWASCSHFLCIWNLEPNDSKCKAKHIGIAGGACRSVMYSEAL